ncbi:hypothetical protein H1R20_g9242, partial [Candolleomyces eurysporus]
MPPTDGFHFVSALNIDLLYDDTDRDVFTFSQSTTRGWTVTAGSGDEEEESLTVTYQGGGLSLYGLAPSAAEGQRFRVSVNGQEPGEASFGGSWSSSSPSPSPSPSSSNSTTLPSSSNTTASLSYGVWYSVQTPETDASSPPTTVRFYNLPPGLSVDHAKVAANKASQNISGPVLVDDTDGNVTYSGSWTQTQESFTLEGKSQVSDAHAYGGGVRVGRQVGDTVQLNFQGSAISVFGLFSQQASSGGGMTVSYTVDKMPPQVRRYGSSSATTTTAVTAENATSATSALGMVSMQNYELFSSGFIAGDKFHSLLINITAIHSPSPAPESQQALVIDYFTYDPLSRDYDELLILTTSTAHDSSKVTPKYAWVLIAVFVGLGLVLVFLSWLRSFLKRRPEVVRRLAETVRLDLEFSLNNARKFLRSTILDIRPQTPPPAPPPSSGSAAQSSRTDGPSGEASAAGGQNPPNQQAQVQELWSIIAYLSRINARLVSAVNVGRSNTASTGSFWGAELVWGAVEGWDGERGPAAVCGVMTFRICASVSAFWL